MHRLALAATVLSLSPGLAGAADFLALTRPLGDVIASEAFCGLSYDQAAISSYIEANVAADDLTFPTELKGAVQMSEFEQQGMSASGKTAHCTQVGRLAKSYGFTS